MNASDISAPDEPRLPADFAKRVLRRADAVRRRRRTYQAAIVIAGVASIAIAVIVPPRLSPAPQPTPIVWDLGGSAPVAAGWRSGANAAVPSSPIDYFFPDAKSLQSVMSLYFAASDDGENDLSLDDLEAFEDSF